MAEKEEILVMDKDGYMVPRELGVDEGARNYESYDEAVDDLNAQSNDVEHKLLEVNWSIGRTAYIIKEKSGYGNHDIDSFARDLGRSPSTVYQAIKLYMAFTLADIQRMRDEDVPLRRANMLVKVSPENRELIEEAMSQIRMDDDTFRTVVNNANDGVVMPEDPSEMRAYVDKCKEGWRPGKDEEEEDDDFDEEDEDDSKPPVDPAEKFLANLRTDCDNMSLDIDKMEQDIAGMSNVLQGDVYKSLSDENLAKIQGVLVSLKGQLSKMLNNGYKLMTKFPLGNTKEADKNVPQ